MKKMLCVALIFLVIPSSINAASTPQELISTAINSLPPHQNWDRVAIFQSVGPMSFEILIYYKEDPEGDEEVEAETKTVAEVILQRLVAEGRDLKKDSVTVYVHGFRQTTRPSGKPSLIDYGFAYYNYADDLLVYRPGPYNPLRSHR